MKTKTPIALILTWFGFAVTPLHPVRATADGNAAGATVQQTGSITGQVSNAATRSFLEGAVVALAGTNQATITDREGRYYLNGVPAGAATVAVSFAGLDTQQIPISVGAGQRVVRDVEMTAEIYRLGKFTVAGEREGTAKAETLQRQAPNVKAVVSSDTFGNVADGNVGDMLQHMAGITANYNGPDVRTISIRGVGGDLNSVTMDGQQVASSQSAGSGRQFEFEQASLGNIESIEVTKAPTPDMDGASIGGSVNLVTKSAFDRTGGRLITFSAGVATHSGGDVAPTRNWEQPINPFGPTINFSYQDVLGAKRNIGITLTGLVHSQPLDGGIISEAFERKNDPGPVYSYSTSRLVIVGGGRARVAAGLKLDYRYSDQTTVAFNMSYNFFHEDGFNRTQALATTGVATAAVPQVLATVDANGNRISGGFINPNYADGITRIYAGANSVSSMTYNGYDKSGRTILFSPKVRHKFDDLSIIYSLSYSNSATYYDVSHNNDKYGGLPKGVVTYRLSNIGWNVDRSKDPIFPTITQTQGPSMNDMSNYSTLLLNQNDRRGFDTVINGKFDLKKDLRVSLPTYIKTGFTYQQQQRKIWQDPRRYNYTGPDGILNTADDNVGLSQFTDIHKPTEDELKFFKHEGGIPPLANGSRVAQNQKLYPELWKEDIAFTSGKLTGNQLIKEQIAAAYIMGNVKLGPLSVLTGVRMEDTRDQGEGALSRITPAEAALRASWVGTVTDAELRRRNLAQFGQRATNKGQYRFYLPGVHLKYEPFGGLVTRLSWSTGVGRPAFGSIIPNTTVSDTARTLSLSNPNLKPQYSNNWDLTAEYYFKPQGLFSVGVFQKRIRDYIATDNSQFVETGPDNGFDGQYVGYRITTQLNSGYATIKGIEVSYQQQLTFLPGWAKGFGLYTNFTKLQTEGKNPSFTAGPGAGAPTAIAGFVNTTGNIGLGYHGYGLDLRLQAVYRGKYLTSNNTIPALVTYQEPKTSWSWKSRYNFSKSKGIFFDVVNIFSVPLDRLYALYPDRVTSYRTFDPKIMGGLTGRF